MTLVVRSPAQYTIIAPSPSNSTFIVKQNSGPEGPAGPAGPIGPAGPQGEPGPAGVADPATSIAITGDDTNATRYLTFTSGVTGNQSLLVDGTTTPLTYNPSTNTVSASITGSAASATTATNVSGGAVNATTGVFAGDVTLGDAGTDITTINSQLSAGGGVGTTGQVLVSRGANLSPEWQTPTGTGGSSTSSSSTADVAFISLGGY